MPFNVKLVFSGICSFVRRDISPGDPLAYCVVLPNGWYDEEQQVCPDPNRPSSCDEVSILRPHRAVVHFDMGRLKSAAPELQGVEGVHFLRGHRLLIKPEGQVPPCTEGDLSGLATYEDLSTKNVTDHLFTVENAIHHPDRCVIAAHVVIEHGELSAPQGHLRWAFDSYLRYERAKDRSLTHKVFLGLGSIDKLRLHVVDLFSGNEIKSFLFDSGDNSQDLEIRVANLCLHDPLQWEPEEEIEKRDPTKDDDFRWHYEIVDDPAAFSSALNGLPAPIPRPVARQGAGNGFNCFSNSFPPVKFDPASWQL